MRIIKSVLTCGLALVLLSSCGNKPQDYTQNSDFQTSYFVTDTTEKKELYTVSTDGTDTIEINGIVYRNKFQGDLILRNPQYKNEPVLIDDTGRYFQLEGTDYELIYDVTSSQIGHSESVYCRDDQWQELKAYYSDTENFSYQYITNQKGGKFESHTVDEMDIKKLNELISFCEKNSYNPFSGSDSDNTRTVSTSSLSKTEYRFGMNSNDGLFSSGAASLYISENKLVLEYYSMMRKGKTLVIDVPEDLSDYFISIINNP